MNKALHFNEDSLITSQSSNIRIVLIQKVLMQLQRGTNAMIAELVFGEILIKFLEKFWSSFWRNFDQVFGECLIKFLEKVWSSFWNVFRKWFLTSYLEPGNTFPRSTISTEITFSTLKKSQQIKKGGTKETQQSHNYVDYFLAWINWNWNLCLLLTSMSTRCQGTERNTWISAPSMSRLK